MFFLVHILRLYMEYMHQKKVSTYIRKLLWYLKILIIFLNKYLKCLNREMLVEWLKAMVNFFDHGLDRGHH